MAELREKSTYQQGVKASAGQQRYFLAVSGPAHGATLSVVSFNALEKIGEPYRIAIELTYRDALSRTDYLGRDAVFTICQADLDGQNTELRKFSGCITRFSKIKTTADFSAYQIVVEAHIARLSLTRASRIFQHQTAPQIIEAILRRHGFKGHQFSFKLRRHYPQHPFRFQYQIADWSYIHLLMEQEGMYSYIVPGKFGDVVVFADDIDHYLYQPELKVPYCETSGLESDSVAVTALQTHAQVVPASFLVADYNPDKADERFKADVNLARQDVTTYGQPYIYGTHHLDQAGAKWEAQLRHEAALAWQVVYQGESTVFDLCPARILQLDASPDSAAVSFPSGDTVTLDDGSSRQVIVEVTHSGARDTAYRNNYTAIPSTRRFRLQLAEENWPKISGSLSGRVTSPGNYKYAYLTRQGHYTVRFDCDFDTWNPGGESVPLRLAKPFAGGSQTGFHFPALEGSEAVLMFRDGDPNKPYIAQFHHNSRQTDPITNQERWFSRSVIRTQSNNKLRFEDGSGQEGIKLSTEHAGKSQLNLGYLVDRNKQKRGEGFELRTSGWGAIRGGRGLFISADDQVNAEGGQLGMQQAMAVLDQAMAQMQGLSNVIRKAQADLSDLQSQTALKDAEIKDLQRAVLLLSAPAGIAAVTAGSIQHSAGETLTFTAGKNIDIGAAKNMTIAVSQAVSMLAHHGGMKLFAVEGTLQAQAQTGKMALAAQQNLSITSTQGQVQIAAEKALMLMCQGAYIKLEGGSIEIGCPGDVKIRAADFDFDGPASKSLAEKLPKACASQAGGAASGGAGVVAR